MSAIARLFQWGSPADVSGEVSARVVDPINALLVGRSSPDIGEKGRKIFGPLRVYAERSITFVVTAAWVGAAILYLLPYPVLRYAMKSMRRHRGAEPRAGHFITQAPARLAVTSTKAGSDNDPFVAAIASTQPSGRAAWVRLPVQHDIPTETLPTNVIEFLSHKFLVTGDVVPCQN